MIFSKKVEAQQFSKSEKINQKFRQFFAIDFVRLCVPILLHFHFAMENRTPKILYYSFYLKKQTDMS